MNLLYVDLFCGAGGTSTGVESAKIDGKQCAKVIACVNHDKNAIASHAANHPDALHFTEDIRTLQLSPLVEHTTRMRQQYPEAYLVLWASLECTNFSKAKGGQPRDADSRTLAEHLFRYIEALNPDYIQIENVEEFMSWGDMDEHGKPISRDKGKCYMRWCNKVRRYGYDYDYRILNAADFGAYTSRKRFFGCFARHGLPIVWPEQTHCKQGIDNGLFGTLPKWKPVKEVLDFEEEGESIFCRKKPLADKTLERIYAGLIKFVAGGKDAFLVKWNSMSQRGKYVPPSIDSPCPTVATQQRLGVERVSFLSKQFSGDPDSKNQSLEHPAGTITTIDHHAFVTAYYGNGHNHSVSEPAPTITTKDRLAVVSSKFLCSYNFKDAGKDISRPCPTLLTKDRLSLVSPKFIDMQYGQGKPTSIDEPAGTVTANPKHNVVTCKRFLLNPQYSTAGGSVDKPCFTLIARMDKMPPYLVQTEEGEVAILIEPTDSVIMRKIKEFMSLYGIVDIKMRMLLIPELKRIMGFPEEYVLVGTQAEQKKYIGNAVEVTVARAWCEALCVRLKKQDRLGCVNMKTMDKTIALMAVDSDYPNLALMKIAAYHRSIGDKVEWYNPFDRYDILYMSKIFNFTPDYPYHICNADEVVRGGTGYDLYSVLPETIEHIAPDYSVYPAIDRHTAYGFLTRGCPNKCKWCVVPQKEGGIRPYHAIQKIAIDGRDHLILMDNNVLASEYGLGQIEEIVRRGLWVDFNQGLDARLVTPEVASLLARVRWIKRIRFGCDTPAQIDECERAVALIDRAGYNGEYFFYCILLDDFKESYTRVNHWRHRGKRYVTHCQPYRDMGNPYQKIPQWQKDMARWADRKELFYSCGFADFEPRKGFLCGEYFRIYNQENEIQTENEPARVEERGGDED